jgi:hypothetical protein
MKRQETLSQRDLELLNAYLDNALNEKERQHFEERLARSLPLQKKLKEYTQLKVALRELPKQPSPRNFTLSPEQARAYKPGPKLYPAFSYVALTAVLLLAIVFSSEFFFNQFSTPMATQMGSPTMEAETFALKSSEKEPEPLIFTWGYPEIGGMGGGAGGSGLESGTTFTITGLNQGAEALGQDTIVAGGGMETPAPEVGALSVPPEEGTGVGEGGEEATPSPEATPIPTEVEPPFLAATPASVTVEPLILGLQEDKAGQIIATYPQPSDQAEKAEPTQMWRTLVSDNVKIGLAAIAALFGVLALVFYTKR